MNEKRNWPKCNTWRNEEKESRRDGRKKKQQKVAKNGHDKGGTNTQDCRLGTLEVRGYGPFP